MPQIKLNKTDETSHTAANRQIQGNEPKKLIVIFEVQGDSDVRRTS